MKEFTQAMRKWQKSCSDPNSNAQRTLCLLKSVLGNNNNNNNNNIFL